MTPVHSVGFSGGGSTFTLGPASDVVCFFDCVSLVARDVYPKTDFSLITDRLYRRYLRRESMDEAIQLMVLLKEAFSRIPSSTVKQFGFQPDSASRLDLSLEKLDYLFAKYFEDFAHCAESAKLSYETFANNSKYVYEYEPVRTISTDLPVFLEEKETPLADYDKNDGMPFWLKTAVQPALNA
jgi:hypothetical protein